MTRICGSLKKISRSFIRQFQTLEVEKAFKFQVCITFVLFEKQIYIFEHNIYFVSEERTAEDKFVFCF